MAEPRRRPAGGRGRRGRRAADAEPFAAPLPHDDAWIDTLRDDPDSAGDDPPVAPPWAVVVAEQRAIILALSARVEAVEAALRDQKVPSPPAAPSAPTVGEVARHLRRRVERTAGRVARRQRRG